MSTVEGWLSRADTARTTARTAAAPVMAAAMSSDAHARSQHDDRDAKARAGGNAEREGVRQRISKKGLHLQARNAERRTGEERR
jgi:hypothetical protein